MTAQIPSRDQDEANAVRHSRTKEVNLFRSIKLLISNNCRALWISKVNFNQCMPGGIASIVPYAQIKKFFIQRCRFYLARTRAVVICGCMTHGGRSLG